MPDGQLCVGEGPVGVGLEMRLHRPPINRLGGTQKQLGGVPRRPPVHLAFDGSGLDGVGFELGDAFGSHCPERVACVPAGHGLVPCVPPSCLPPLTASRRQAPRSKCVPRGQQLGGVPIGRLPSQTGGFVVGLPLLPLVPPPPVPGVGEWPQRPPRKTVPFGQQLGGLPTGRLRGQIPLSPGCVPLVRPLPVRHMPSLKNVPGGQQLG